jgi:hypothetical protein
MQLFLFVLISPMRSTSTTNLILVHLITLAIFGKDTCPYPLYRRLGGPQGRSRRVRKISTPHRDSIPGPSTPYRVAIRTELSRSPIRFYVHSLNNEQKLLVRHGCLCLSVAVCVYQSTLKNSGTVSRTCTDFNIRVFSKNLP